MALLRPRKASRRKSIRVSQLPRFRLALAFGHAHDDLHGARKLSAKAFTLGSAVELRQEDDGSFGVAVELRATMPGVDEATAEELLRAAHGVCPYSRATRGNIPVRLFLDEREVGLDPAVA